MEHMTDEVLNDYLEQYANFYKTIDDICVFQSTVKKQDIAASIFIREQKCKTQTTQIAHHPEKQKSHPFEKACAEMSFVLKPTDH